jgi:hypothetical protein
MDDKKDTTTNVAVLGHDRHSDEKEYPIDDKRSVVRLPSLRPSRPAQRESLG